MSEADNIEIVACGQALNQVSNWLGESAVSLLEEADATTEELFEKPRPSLLGLGAKYLSHKSMENSGLEMKLKHRLKRSAEAQADTAAAYQPAQLDRHHHQHSKRSRGGPSRAEVHQQQDSDDEGGKLASLNSRGSNAVQQKRQLFDRQQLLAVPAENLSKWQKKRMRQKAKQQQHEAEQATNQS